MLIAIGVIQVVSVFARVFIFMNKKLANLFDSSFWFLYDSVSVWVVGHQNAGDTFGSGERGRRDWLFNDLRYRTPLLWASSTTCGWSWQLIKLTCDVPRTCVTKLEQFYEEENRGSTFNRRNCWDYLVEGIILSCNFLNHFVVHFCGGRSFIFVKREHEIQMQGWILKNIVLGMENWMNKKIKNITAEY